MIKSNKKNSNVPITKKHYKKFNVMLDKGGVLGQITILKTVVTWILGTQTFPNDCLSSSFTVSLFDHCVVLHRFVPPAPQLQTVEEGREKDRLTTQLFCYVVLFLTRYPYCFLAKALRILFREIFSHDPLGGDITYEKFYNMYLYYGSIRHCLWHCVDRPNRFR